MLGNTRRQHSPPPGVYSSLSTTEVEEPWRRRQRESQDRDAREVNSDVLTKTQAYCLYASHTLSMWDSRMYEFAVIIFIQTAFPGNLLASSINGIAETLCVLLFSSALGRWVDRSPRLPALLLTISVNRITILTSCSIWIITLSFTHTTSLHIFFSIALILGMIEKLSRITNTLSMEQDWVPILANANDDGTTPYTLTHLNTIMRRIDMLCKLLAPLAISESIASLHSERMVAALVATISTLGWAAESWCVRRVYTTQGRLRVPKSTSRDVEPIPTFPHRTTARHLPQTFIHLKSALSSHYLALKYYFASPACIPSLCAAVPHASVLTFSGTLVTYLLNAGVSLTTITIAKVAGAVFEIGSTFVYPWAVRQFSAKMKEKGGRNVEMGERQEGCLLLREWDDGVEAEEEKSDVVEECHRGLNDQGDESAVVNVGLWSICGLLLSLIPALPSLFLFPSSLPTTPNLGSKTNPTLPLLLLSLSLILSLLFRWTYDLSATQLTQTLIPASHRPGFGGTQMSIVSVLSLGHWVAAAVWHAQKDFRWLGLGSFVLVVIAVGGFGGWARRWKER